MLEEIKAALMIAEAAAVAAKAGYEMVMRLVAAAKAKGDPIPDEVLAQIAQRKATLDEIDAIASGTA